MHSCQSFMASVPSMVSTGRLDAYTSSTSARELLQCLAPNSRRRARGFVQLDVWHGALGSHGTADLRVAVQTPIGFADAGLADKND